MSDPAMIAPSRMDALISLLTAICARHGLTPNRTAMLLDCTRQFGSIALSPPSGSPGSLRRPSMHHDGTPIQLSSSLLAEGTGGVRVAVEPGDLAQPVSAQVATSLRLLRATLDQLGWSGCLSVLDSCVQAVLPSDAAEMDSWWGGVWLGAVAHPDYTGIRAYFNLRSGDATQRWRRIGQVFASLTGSPACSAIREIVLLASESVMPVGLGLDMIQGLPAGLKVYLGVPNPCPESLERIIPQQICTDGRTALALFLRRLGATAEPLPWQSVTVAYEVKLDPAGTPAPSVRRFKVDADVARILHSDEKALELVYSMAVDLDVRANDLEAMLTVVPLPAQPGQMIQYVGLGLGGASPHLNVYLRPPGFSLAEGLATAAMERGADA